LGLRYNVRMSEVPFESKETKRIISRHEAMLHFFDIFKLDKNGDPLMSEDGKIEKSPYNPSSVSPEIVEDPYVDTDLLIFFRADGDTLASTKEKYQVFLSQYNIANASIPSEKLKIDEWNGIPCVRVRMLE
jgi:hypothetical protein